MKSLVLFLFLFVSNAHANIFTNAIEFWTSPQLKHAVKKTLLGRNAAGTAEFKVRQLILGLKKEGYPVQYLNEAAPHLDLLIRVKKFEGDEDVMNGAVPYMMFEVKMGVTSLYVPDEYFNPDGSFISVKQMDANMISKIYHELFHLYLEKVVKKDINNQIGLIQDILKVKLRQSYANLEEDILEDVSDEILAHNAEYIMGDYILTKNSILRRKAAGKPMTEEFLNLLKNKMYHPLKMQSKGYSNIPNKDFETHFDMPESIQLRFLKKLFAPQISGILENDFANLLN